MKVKDLIFHLKGIDPELEVCECDINGDVQPIEAPINKERSVYLVREPKPWDRGEDYYEYWTLYPKELERLDEKKVFVIW